MSTTVNIYRGTGQKVVTAVDEGRGAFAMWLVIGTEAALFVGLFSAYFLVGNNKDRWTMNKPPNLWYSLSLLGVLIISALFMIWGERLVAAERYFTAKIALAVSFALGLGFLLLQCFAFIDRWSSLRPTSNSYGSIYYAITMTHDAHVIAGLLMIGYLFFLPLGPRRHSPYRPFHVVALYWYFVTVVLFFVVLILSIIPNGIYYGY